MSAQLSNKVNQLCQKVKNLSTTTNDAYLYAIYENFDANITEITIPSGGAIPYNKVEISKNIEKIDDGKFRIKISGIYRITYHIEPVSSVAGMNEIAVVATDYGGKTAAQLKINDNIINESIDNSFIANINAGNILSVYNATLNNFKIVTGLFILQGTNNISIEKIA